MALKAARNYLVVAIAVASVGAIYEHFSHGVFSYFMLYAFAFPLVLGALPNLLSGMRERKALPSPEARKIWAAGIATMTVGFLFRGALEIYGTDNPLDRVYWIVGGLLLGTGLCLFLRDRWRGSHKSPYTL